ncbi:MAG: hydroxyacid dehydrogenase [Phycisphaeraceae bacterium]|nr:hydroxyacid dehydrogenase [Phycisphaeraceae bacterium]
MNITFFELEPWERDAFSELKSSHDVRFVDEPLIPENAADHADAQVISTFINSEPDRSVIEQLKNLEMIATRSTGFDHIDLTACNERSIVVANVPTYGANTVAEHVFALLLSISHRMEEATTRTRKGDFSPRGLTGFDLQGKTLGVIGTGDIGRHAARIGAGFEMNVIAHDVQPDPDAAEEYGYTYVDFDRLLAESDVITLHVPANEKTHHLIDEDAFDRMKDGVVLINTARGSIVDATALVEALATGKVAGAGLDVLAEEPVMREEAELLRSVYEKRHNTSALLADSILMRMRNVVVTPHSAFNTREAVGRILDTTCDNIAHFIDGDPQNVVNKPD